MCGLLETTLQIIMGIGDIEGYIRLYGVICSWNGTENGSYH